MTVLAEKQCFVKPFLKWAGEETGRLVVKKRIESMGDTGLEPVASCV